jgi:hypothetical protein
MLTRFAGWIVADVNFLAAWVDLSESASDGVAVASAEFEVTDAAE